MPRSLLTQGSGKVLGAKSVSCEGACEAAHDWSAINRLLAVYSPNVLNAQEFSGIRPCGRPPACNLRAWQDERHSKRAARCTSGSSQQCGQPGLQCT